MINDPNLPTQDDIVSASIVIAPTIIPQTIILPSTGWLPPSAVSDLVSNLASEGIVFNGTIDTLTLKYNWETDFSMTYTVSFVQN